MERKVRFAIFGPGTMGAKMTEYAIAHGAEAVAAFTRNSNLGKDLGEVIGTAPLGVEVKSFSDASEILAQTKPDICLVATVGTCELLMETFEICAKAGCDVMTIGEQMLWPWTEAPDLTAQVDELAKKYGVTISASGCAEVPWGTVIAAMAAGSAYVERIRVEANLNLEDYGKGVLPLYPDHGIGFTMEEFETKVAAFEPTTDENGHWPCLPGDQNGWLCRYMGLTPVSQSAYHEPLTYHEDVYSQNMEAVIPAGNLLGMNKVVSTVTEESITVEYAMAGKVFSPEDKDRYVITIYGQPQQNIIIEQPSSPHFTAATPVNRIPDVLNAKPGFVTTDMLPRGMYLARPMNEYVEKEN
ncbi:MAG: hypothetical protein E7430_04980 [Ruminococcaceae bacterium]|nr:hypothetical protein [Oscillospiraceae bacterium]